MLVLGIKPRSSKKVASALNPWAIFPPPSSYFSLKKQNQKIVPHLVREALCAMLCKNPDFLCFCCCQGTSKFSGAQKCYLRLPVPSKYHDSPHHLIGHRPEVYILCVSFIYSMAAHLQSLTGFPDLWTALLAASSPDWGACPGFPFQDEDGNLFLITHPHMLFP